MYFRKTLVCLAIASIIEGCGWDDQYKIVDCTSVADASVVDCRSDGADENTEFGESVTDDGNGNSISFERIDSELQLLTSSSSLSWLASHADQIDLFVTAVDEKLLLGSKYHNYLRAFQSDNAGQVVALDSTAFLDVSGERYAIDALTGASEQIFNGLDLNTHDGETMIIARAEKVDESSDSTGVGLYIEPLQGLDALPERAFASGDSSNFISYGSLRASAVSPDGSRLAVTGSDRVVREYAIGHYDAPLHDTSLSIRGSSLTYSHGGDALYVGGLALSGVVVSLSTDDLSENWALELADKPLELLPQASGGVVAVLASGNDAYWIEKNGEQNAIVKLPLANQATAATINRDGTVLVIADTGRGVEAISLLSGSRAYIEHDASVQSVAIDGFSTIWVSSQGELQGYRLPEGFE